MSTSVNRRIGKREARCAAPKLPLKMIRQERSPIRPQWLLHGRRRTHKNRISRRGGSDDEDWYRLNVNLRVDGRLLYANARKSPPTPPMDWYQAPLTQRLLLLLLLLNVTSPSVTVEFPTRRCSRQPGPGSRTESGHVHLIREYVVVMHLLRAHLKPRCSTVRGSRISGRVDQKFGRWSYSGHEATR